MPSGEPLGQMGSRCTPGRADHIEIQYSLAGSMVVIDLNSKPTPAIYPVTPTACEIPP